MLLISLIVLNYFFTGVLVTILLCRVETPSLTHDTSDVMVSLLLWPLALWFLSSDFILYMSERK